MTCYHPLKGWWSKEFSPAGKRFVVFSPRNGLVDRPVEVPCGQCIGCRLERSRQWAVRCSHEAMMYDENCFITLTYDDDHIPSDWSLRPEDFVKFMKRLRKRYGEGIKYYHAGEYGELCQICGMAKALHRSVKEHRFIPMLGRPHHHAILFGIDFKDKVQVSKNKSGQALYASAELMQLWNNGNCIIGAVTFDSAAYVARYITKKLFGDRSIEHYKGKKPEYTTMSKGVGKAWFEKYGHTVKRDDDVVIEKHRIKPPRYYDKLMEIDDPKHVELMKVRRLAKAEKMADFGNSKRLAVNEKLQLKRYKQLKRGLSDDI